MDMKDMETTSLLNLLNSPDPYIQDSLNQNDVGLPTGVFPNLTDLDVYQIPLEDPQSISKDLQIPVDPHLWDTSQVLRWIEWTLTQTNSDELEICRIKEQLLLQSIKGDHLTKWSAFEYDNMFNYRSEYLRQQMTNWLQALQTSDFFLGPAQPGYDIEYNWSTWSNDPGMYQQPFHNVTNNMVTAQGDFTVNYDTFGDYQPIAHPNQRVPEYPPYTWNREDDNSSFPITREPINSGSSDAGESSSDEEDFVQDYVPTKSTGTKRRHPILYKFILEHLNDPSTSRGYVEWVNKSEGLFRFNSRRKDKFAEMWSKAKGKKQPMTYQNMARALRNYTRPNKRIMERVPKKLHYKFVPEFIE